MVSSTDFAERDHVTFGDGLHPSWRGRVFLKRESGSRETSRQLNTHNTEAREVCYPCHPWCGRSVAVYEVLVKYGQSVSRCGLEEERTRRAVEIPTWMLEPAARCRLRVMAEPSVGCDALLELKALLRTAPLRILAACYKPSIVPCSWQEVLMQRLLNRPRLSQPTLFQPPHPRPSFQTSSPEIQENTIRLLARLLRVHVDRGLASGQAQEAGYE